MIPEFLDFIRQKQLFTEKEKVLLAISGGMDSMVMLNLFDQAGFDFSAIHCNFRLRGKESDEDEAFLKEICERMGIYLFITRFDTREYARLNGISVEMAARELRYDYFEKIRSDYNFSYIATAHHQDDKIETFFVNLTRKSGIKGLAGINEKSGKIIRPMLFTSRHEIEEYARKYEIPFREDSTNNELIFQRNFIRHRLLPLFENLNPAARKNILSTIDNLREASNVYNSYISPRIKILVKDEGNFQSIPIPSLFETEYSELVLYEALNQFNFNSFVVKEILTGLKSESGRQFFSRTHRIVKDRDRLIITARGTSEPKSYYIEDGDIELFAPFEISIENIKNNNFKIPPDPLTACLDRDLLEFPLLIRKWEQGEYFQPLGMQGLKKISDFLIDEKVPIPEKENTWILHSGKKVVWVIGKRIDNRFRITKKTKNIFILRIKNNQVSDSF